MRVEKMAVAGLGLIGGSLYKAALAAGYEVKGLHHGESEGLADADLVFVALPADAIVPWVKAHAAEFKRNAVVVDVCGVKAPIMAALSAVPREGWKFVGGHPMAGKEKGGWENSSAELFRGASMILTPFEGEDEELLGELRRVFADLGFGTTVTTSPKRHDAIIAFTSQLGHVIASAYSQDELVAHAVGFSAGSYANMTRIATMDPEGWASLFLANRENLLAVLDGFMARLAEFRSALGDSDRTTLQNFILKGANAKERELASRK